MEYRRYRDRYIIRIDKDEEIIDKIHQFAEQENIRLASVSGIGAADSLTIGLFDTRQKQYKSGELNGDYEITSLSGTITRMNGKVYPHLHITLSDENFRAFGGHLNRAVVSGTCEIVVSLIDGEIDRSFDSYSGLNLIRFGTP